MEFSSKAVRAPLIDQDVAAGLQPSSLAAVSAVGYLRDIFANLGTRN